MIDFLQTHVVYYLFLCALFGLIIGSFLNVVVYRLPIILQREWQNQCVELLNLPQAANENDVSPFNLWIPRSHCPQCKNTIPFFSNFPLLTFILQKGKCLHCKKSIHWRYPLIECLAGFFALMSGWYFGVSFEAIAAMVYCFILIALVFIDLESFLLPDHLTLLLLWLGLLLSVFSLFFVTSSTAILGAVVGYVVLWVIGKVYYVFTHIEGMGYGDYKLTAAMGAWLGWKALPLLISIAAILAMFIAGAVMIKKKMDLRAPIPFGPFLAAAGLIMLFWGNPIMAYYYRLL